VYQSARDLAGRIPGQRLLEYHQSPGTQSSRYIDQLFVSNEEVPRITISGKSRGNEQAGFDRSGMSVSDA
jgi:hypothetical protein